MKFDIIHSEIRLSKCWWQLSSCLRSVGLRTWSITCWPVLLSCQTREPDPWNTWKWLCKYCSRFFSNQIFFSFLFVLFWFVPTCVFTYIGDTKCGRAIAICCRTSIVAATHSSTGSCRKTFVVDSEPRYDFALKVASLTFACALVAVIVIKGAAICQR